MTTPSLACSALSKRFGHVVALDSVSLKLTTPEVVALIGPNGAGKTTLIDVLTGFVRPDAGECSIGGRTTTRRPPYWIARLGVARTFQDPRLVRREPVFENVRLAAPASRGEGLFGTLFGSRRGRDHSQNGVLQVLQTVGLVEMANTPAGELSFGQQKLLALACCLATRARVLLLDEPFAGISPGMASQIIGLLRSTCAAGHIIVFIEHDMEAVRQLADRVLLMVAGRIIGDGRAKEVLEKSETLEAYLE